MYKYTALHNFTTLYASVVPTSDIRTTGVIGIFICQQLSMRLALASIGLISASVFVTKRNVFKHTRRTDRHAQERTQHGRISFLN